MIKKSGSFTKNQIRRLEGEEIWLKCISFLIKLSLLR